MPRTATEGETMLAMTAQHRLISTGEAALALGVTRQTLINWMEDGDVTAAGRTGGGHYRWHLDELRIQVAAMIERRTPGGSRPTPAAPVVPPPPPPAERPAAKTPNELLDDSDPLHG